ncbi:MAG TPA: NUDIX domain-containing protein [Actinophytocola sp.]|uniref:NUDIX domain-containing protein n=1 Tax=Actinophytocola sp. TaxID=1872138 RepID=UPI002DBF0FA1|nr:NUDIX domain-containing protein [Actinophytocola sp.]HEU5469159.1 NUDIX domain-containing protein [Actinophytocola sp.]
MVRKAEYYYDAAAPPANSVRPAAFAAARDPAARILLAQRADTRNWELPGGSVEPGESAVNAVVREVAEETGVLVTVTGLSGIYTDPAHVMVYSTGEVRQPFAVCLHAIPVAGQPRPDRDEMIDVAWIDPGELDGLPIHPSMRLRIEHAIGLPGRVQLT